MDNRYRDRGNQQQGNRDRWSSGGRQDEQFSSGSDEQYGESGWRSQSGDRWSGGQDFGAGQGRGRSDSYQRDDFSRSGSGYRGDTSSLDDYDQADITRYGRQESTRSPFRNNDYGGQDYPRGRGGYGQSRNMQGYGERSYGGGSYGADMYDRGGSRGGSHIPPRNYDRDERGFFDRATDEVMSWFGDDDAARRRKMDSREDHRGKGPQGYTRSKERILEDANERLMHDSALDASRITVTCEDNEITLNGTVDSRWAKRRAEDIVEDVSGVKHVQNNLRVETRENYYGQSDSSSSEIRSTGTAASKTQS
jgi:osmotically-inducible protein OsmY